WGGGRESRCAKASRKRTRPTRRRKPAEHSGSSAGFPACFQTLPGSATTRPHNHTPPACAAPALLSIARLRSCAFPKGTFPLVFHMIAPETFNHIENIKKRAGHLWRFL